MYHLGPQIGGPRCPPHKATEFWRAELSCMAEAKECEIGPYGKGNGIQKHKVTHKHESNMNHDTTLNERSENKRSKKPKTKRDDRNKHRPGR